MKTQLKDLLKKSSTRKALIGTASFLVLTIGGGGAAYAYYQTPVAYLSLDINPSVELGVNAFDKVVTAEGYNEDGQTILDGLDVTGSTVDEAVQSLITSADEKGYIANDGSTVISLTSETNDSEKAAEIQATSEAGAKEALEGLDKEAVVQKDNVAIARRDEARELGITPGKLNLINKLQEVYPDATIEDFKDASVKEIMKTIKENRKAEKANDVDTDKENTDKSQILDTNLSKLSSEVSTEDSTEAEATLKESKQNDSNKSQNAIEKQAAKVNHSGENTTDIESKEDVENTTKSTIDATKVGSDEYETKSKIKENNASDTKKDNTATTASNSNKKDKN